MSSIATTAAPALERRLQTVTRRAWIGFALIAVLLAMQSSWWWNPGLDASSYFSIARNMAQGHFQSLGSTHLRHAPGYPALIAPACWVSDEPFLLISAVHLALGMLFAGGVYVWLRRLAPQAAIALTVLVMANASLWEHYRMTHSELAFMTELVWSAYAVTRCAESPAWRGSVLWGILAAFTAALACVTRQAGIALIAGAGMTLLIQAIRKHVSWRKAATIVAGVSFPSLAAFVAVLVWDHARAAELGPAGKSYGEYMLDPNMTLFQQLAEGLRLRISECGRLLLPGMMKTYARNGQWLHINMAIFCCASAGVVYGWWKLAARKPDPLLWAIPFYAALYMIWPFDQATRYMLPMLPVLVAGLWLVLSRWQNRQLTLVAVLIFLHLAVAVGYWLRDRDPALLARWRELAPLGRTLQQNAAPAATLNLDPSTAMILSVQANRWLPPAESPAAIPAEFRWLLSCNEQPGYERRAAAGKVLLLERSDPMPATRPRRDKMTR